MAQKSPKQMVDEKFQGRKQLVDAIVSLTDGDDGTRSSLMGTTNKKLLRIHEVATTVKDRFGGKSGLLDALAKLQFGNGKVTEGWRNKMEGYTAKRLLDMHRQLSTTKTAR